MAKCGLKHSKCILESVGKKEVDSVICRKTGNSWVYLGTRDILKISDKPDTYANT